MIPGRVLKTALLVATALLVVATIALYAAIRTFNAPGPLPAEATVVIPRGASLNVAAQTLESEGVVASGLFFSIGARVTGNAGLVRAGEYSFPPAASMAEVMLKIVSGRTVQRRVTVPEGLSSRQVVALLNAADGLEGDIDTIPGEGTLLPDTYFYSLWDTRGSVLQRMRDRHDEALWALWDKWGGSTQLRSPEEVVTLASIVEKETGVAAERRLVAAVFLNRLAQNMRLQSDPTVIYGLTGGDPLGRPLRRSELERETPYNTYIIRGLPPGPIANPGLASLQAVLDPADTAALYFVADGTGGHVFAETLEDHNRNVAQWRQIERERAAGNR